MNFQDLRVLTVVACEIVLLEETVREESDVLCDVLGQELGQGAGDAVGLDCEGNSVLGALHEPCVVVNDSESSLETQRKVQRTGGGSPRTTRKNMHQPLTR